MSSPPRASTSIIVAAVVAILAALLILASVAFGFLGISYGLYSQYPPFLLYATLGVFAFVACLSGFGIATGIGLMFLRKWARISVLIWGGLSVFFSIFGIAEAFSTPWSAAPGLSELPAGTMQGIHVLLICFYSVPAIIGCWWLFLFSRKSVAAQFAGVLGAPAPQKPSPPTPIAILAWLYITSAAHIVLLPFLPFSLPFMLFGHFFFGTVATVAYILVCLIFVTAGIGMLKLKQWSYSLSIGLQSFFLASTIVTLLNPNYEARIASWNERLQEAMQLPADLRYNPIYQHHPHWPMYVGPAIPLAVIVMQFYYRRRFLSEANLAAAGAATLANHGGRTENSQSS